MDWGVRAGAGRKAVGLMALIVLAVGVAGKGWAEPASAKPKLIEALDSIRNVTRPQQDGYSTVWDGDKYVQCHVLSNQSLSCEAAGALMQPSLERVLTPDRKERLAALGWRPDANFGAYVQVFPPGASLDETADRILATLSQAYGADLTSMAVQTRWVAHQACPPRHGPNQDLAGLVDDSPGLASTAVHGCAYSAPAGTTAAVASGSAGAHAAAAAVVADLVVSDPGPGDPGPAVSEAIEGRHVRTRTHRIRTSSPRRESTGTRHSRAGHSSRRH